MPEKGPGEPKYPTAKSKPIPDDIDGILGMSNDVVDGGTSGEAAEKQKHTSYPYKPSVQKQTGDDGKG